MARMLGGELEIDKPPAPPAPAPAPAPAPDAADRLAAAIEAQTRVIERALTRVAAPPPVVAAEEPPPQLVPLAQRAIARAPKPKRTHAYQIIVQPNGQIRVERDGVARYQFVTQQDGRILVERDGVSCYQIDSQRDDAGLTTRLSLTPIAPEGA